MKTQAIDIPSQEKLPQDMSIPEILEQREKLQHYLEDIQAGIKVFSDELLIRLNDEKLSGMIVGEHSVSKAVRYSFKTPIQWAKEHGAVIESIDSKQLKKLLLSGVDVPEANKTEYVLVKRISRDES